MYIIKLFSHDTDYFVFIVDDQIHFKLTLSSYRQCLKTIKNITIIVKLKTFVA